MSDTENIITWPEDFAQQVWESEGGTTHRPVDVTWQDKRERDDEGVLVETEGGAPLDRWGDEGITIHFVTGPDT